MIIKNIEWIGYEEATLTISDNEVELVAFCHPFNGKLGGFLEVTLDCLDVKNIELTDKQSFYALRLDNNFKQEILAKVVDKKNNIISVASIKIAIDYILGDIKKGDYVKVICDRLDL